MTRPYHTRQRVYLTADGRIVGAGDPDASALLYPMNTDVPADAADRYGLAEFDALPQDVETRALDEPPATRAVRPPRPRRR
jgi:hypothetical protein